MVPLSLAGGGRVGFLSVAREFVRRRAASESFSRHPFRDNFAEGGETLDVGVALAAEVASDTQVTETQ